MTEPSSGGNRSDVSLANTQRHNLTVECTLTLVTVSNVWHETKSMFLEIVGSQSMVVRDQGFTMNHCYFTSLPI